jgi:hypothetical protein
LKAERRIISERRMIQHIPGGIFRASFKFIQKGKAKYGYRRTERRREMEKGKHELDKKRKKGAKRQIKR